MVNTGISRHGRGYVAGTGRRLVHSPRFSARCRFRTGPRRPGCGRVTRGVDSGGGGWRRAAWLGREPFRQYLLHSLFDRDVYFAGLGVDPSIAVESTYLIPLEFGHVLN